MRTPTRKTLAALTAAACLGGAGWAFAASSSGGGSAGGPASSSGSSTPTASAAAAAPGYGAPAPNGQQGPPAGNPGGPRGHRPDETPLTGDNAAKAKAAALAKLPGATIVRVETDADGGGVYEAHVTKSDGSPATVLFDRSFNVLKVLDR